MKLYEYKGKIYCEEDISLENDDYVGDLYDLYWELKKTENAMKQQYIIQVLIVAKHTLKQRK